MFSITSVHGGGGGGGNFNLHIVEGGDDDLVTAPVHTGHWVVVGNALQCSRLLKNKLTIV